MPLLPALRAYLDELNPRVAEAARAGVVATPESARAALAALAAYAAAPAEVAQVEDRVIAGVPVRVYTPRPADACDVVLFVHGGGHLAGDLDVYDSSARRTAVATGMVVVSVDYRRAPEAPFPAGLNDVYAVLHALAGGLGGVRTTGRVHAMADSGGAAKVASIAMRVARGEWSSPLARQVLLYPSLDYTMSGASMREFATGHLLTAERVAWYFDHYFPADPDGVAADRRAASPLGGPYAAGMPETLVIAAEYDPLRSEAEEYVARARAAGAPVSLLIAPGTIHAFAFFETLIPREVARLYDIVGGFLREGTVPGKW